MFAEAATQFLMRQHKLKLFKVFALLFRATEMKKLSMMN